MVTKLSCRPMPSFDFGTNHDLGRKTGTIAELLKEINLEYNPKSGEPANFRSLKRVLDLIQELTGEPVPSSTAPVALSALKAIKLLFLANHKSTRKRHLIGLIEPPSAATPATMEFCTGTTVSRDKEGAEIINSLIDALAREIDPAKLNQLAELAEPTETATFAEAFISHIERTNDVVYRILSDDVADSRGQANAYYALSRSIDPMRYRRSHDERFPVHETVHCHLLTLGLQHFILHHRAFIRSTLSKSGINPIEEQCTHLCNTLGEIRNAPVDPREKLLSVNEFPTLVAVFHKELNALVKAATGLDTRKERFFENIPLAQAILASYGYRSHDESSLEVRLLSIFDIVAALCSVRHQQEAGTEYVPYWPGQKSPGTSPQAMFKKGMRKADPHQHQGVAQIYLYRFGEYQATFANAIESYRAWMAYQISRLDGYARILQIREIGGIVASARHFDEMCLQEAKRIAFEHASRKFLHHSRMDMEMGSVHHGEVEAGLPT
jgi:hypothetical protein